MKPPILATLLWMCGCTHLHVSYGNSSPLAVVQPSHDNDRWYLTSDIGQDSLWFVDTGYPITTCDQSLADRLALPIKGRIRYRGAAGKGVAQKADLPSFHIGDHQIHGVRCMVRDLGASSSVSSAPEVEVLGVLGMDVLRHFRFSFDAKERILLLEKPSEPSELPTKTNKAVLKRQLNTTVWIGDKPVTVLIDSGATDTQIPGKRLGLVPSKIHVGATMRGSGGVGWQVRDLTHYQETLRIEPFAYWNVELTERIGAHSLLGLDVLNYANQTWEPTSGRALVVWSERGPGRPWRPSLKPSIQASSSPSNRAIEALSAGGNE